MTLFYGANFFGQICDGSETFGLDLRRSYGLYYLLTWFATRSKLFPQKKCIRSTQYPDKFWSYFLYLPNQKILIKSLLPKFTDL